MFHPCKPKHDAFEIVNNVTAAEMIPIRLMISVAIIGFISFLFASGMIVINNQHAEHQLQQQLHDLEPSLQVLVKMGTARDVQDPLSFNGSRRTYTFHIDKSIDFLSFGGDFYFPSSAGNEMSSNHCMSGIFYRFHNGNKQVIWLDTDCKLVKGYYVDSFWIPTEIPNPLIIDTNGSITLNFELIKKNNVNYILVYPLE